MRPRSRGRGGVTAAAPPVHRFRSARLINSLNLVNEALETVVQPERAAWAALVALTAGEGLGFNRAFVLLNHADVLQGWFAVGLRSREEAAAVWSDIRQRGLHPLERLSDPPGDLLHEELARHADILERLTHPVCDSCRGWRHAFIARANHPHASVRHWLRVLDSEALAVLPMMTADGPWAVVLADNFVTRGRIRPHTLEAAQMIVHALRAALDRTQLLERLQEEHRRRVAAEHATAMLETARTLAHDLKNPLALAGGLAREVLAAPLPAGDALTKRLAIIVNAVQRAEERLAQLGEELTARVTTVALTPLDVGDAVERVVASFRPLAESRHIHIQLYRPGRGVTAAAERSLLDRCVENLIGNCLQALRDSDVPGPAVRVAVFAVGDWAQVEIGDNGPPLPGELRADPFAGGVSTRRSGTGLGLVSVRRLAEAMGGRVEYDERDPGWVRFTLFLRRSS